MSPAAARICSSSRAPRRPDLFSIAAMTIVSDTRQSPPRQALTGPSRLGSIDLVRGAIMVVMALDHTREFFGLPINPTNLATTTPSLFLTRWITHFCAPGFFLLMGTGAFLAGQRRQTSELPRFLLTRGAWLIVLDLVVLRCFAYQFNFDYRVTMLLVLWALGWALIALGLVVRLSPALIATIGGVMIAGHNLFDGVRPANPLWMILHSPGVVLDVSEHVVFVAYPLVPWIGVTMVGYALGRAYTWPAERRRRFLIRLGLALTLAFVIVRGLNVYGDPSPWSVRQSPLFTFLSFLNTSKQPPALSFLLMTIGPVLLALAVAERPSSRWLRPVLDFGRVPLFYFALHFAALHALAALVAAVQFGAPRAMFESPDLAHYPFSAPPGWGVTLGSVYLIWIALVVALYPVCRWFAAIKARRRDWWLSYL
jgi:uncharacterized membrane protein